MIESSPPSPGCMRQWMGSTLIHIMACRLFGATALTKPMLGYCQLNPWEHTSVKLLSKYRAFHSRNASAKWQPFCPGEDELILNARLIIDPSPRLFPKHSTKLTTSGPNWSIKKYKKMVSSTFCIYFATCPKYYMQPRVQSLWICIFLHLWFNTLALFACIYN